MIDTRAPAWRSGLSATLAGLALSASSATGLAQTAPPSEAPAVLQEVIVTATRREEEQSKVPISLSVVTEQQIDRQGFRTLDDIARITPGVQFDAATGSIIIRGIDATSIGAGTVGIYIDETPIQVRTFGTDATNAVQHLFDIERVEILRGPQGTLFGAGSESGAVRYITPQPSLDDSTLYARGEVNKVEHGSVGGELGVAAGGPIVPDEVGFRVSAWSGHTAGYVDRVSNVPPNHALIDSNSNWVNTNILRAALTIKPTAGLYITPSVLYQSSYTNASSSFLVGLSDPGNGVFKNNNPTPDYRWDQYWLPSLHIQYHTGPADVIYNLSYFNRGQYGNNDYTNFFSDLFGLSTPTGPNLGPLPGYYAHTDAVNTQRNVTQELRFQSVDPKARVSWVAGLFWSHLSQNNRENTHDPQYYEFFSQVLGFPNFGPLVPPDYSYMGEDNGIDRQTAVFAQLDFHITDKLTLTAGMRYSHFNLSFEVIQNGPYAGGPPPIVNEGSTTENASTPKFALSYQANGNNLFYVSASKGFRPGGVADPLPYNACKDDLNALGYTSAPTSFSSDSVWSYEIGSKNNLADGRVRLAASVYRIDWSNIQTSIYLPTCGFSLTTNLGTARSRGFDFQGDFVVAPGVTIGLLVGRTDATYTETINGPRRPDGTLPIIAVEGNTLGAPPWTVTGTFDWAFKVGPRDAYFRGNYSYIQKNTQLLPAQDPVTTSYDPATYPVPTSHYVTVRTGMLFNRLDVSLFVNNLTNESVLLTRTHGAKGSPMFQGTVYPPRTAGLTLVYRY
jgi:outer membrane receptor protein involved in Fe transport